MNYIYRRDYTPGTGHAAGGAVVTGLTGLGLRVALGRVGVAALGTAIGVGFWPMVLGGTVLGAGIGWASHRFYEATRPTLG